MGMHVLRAVHGSLQLALWQVKRLCRWQPTTLLLIVYDAKISKKKPNESIDNEFCLLF